MPWIPANRAAISGAWVALHDAFTWMDERRLLREWPLADQLGAVSVGVVDGTCVCDLDYPEDSKAETDMNLVMTSEGEFVEVQGSAENGTFSRAQHDALLDVAAKGCEEIFALQRDVLAQPLPLREGGR